MVEGGKEERREGGERGGFRGRKERRVENSCVMERQRESG